jgi:hypothetical protein
LIAIHIENNATDGHDPDEIREDFIRDLAAAIAPLVEALEEIRALPRDREDEARLVAGRALWEVQR